MDQRSSYLSSNENLLNILPELSEDILNDTTNNEDIYYSQVQPVQNSIKRSHNLNKMGVKSQSKADSKRNKHKRNVPLIESPAYESSPILSTRYRPLSLQHSISHDNLLRSIDSVQNVTANLHYSSTNNPIQTLPRSFSSQPQTQQMKNSFASSCCSVNDTSVPPVPPKVLNPNIMSSTLPFYGRTSSIMTQSSPIDIYHSTGTLGILSLSELLLKYKLPIVVRIVKGYCVEDGDEESDEKVVLTEGDQILILNLCFKDCVKIYFPEGTKTLSIPSDCECKYEIMSAICHFDNVNKITVPDIIKNKSFSGRLRVIHDFTHPHVGTIHCGTIISVVKYDVKTNSIVVQIHEGNEFILSSYCKGEFSTYLVENPSSIQNHLEICRLPQRVIVRGDFYTGFMKQYLDSKIGFVEHYGREDFLFCKELVNVDGSLIPGKSWTLPIDNEIWVERMDEIKVIEHGYDVLNPDCDYDKLDNGIKDPKHRFYEKEISDLKILNKRLEFKVSQLQKELKQTGEQAIATIECLTKEKNRLCMSEPELLLKIASNEQYTQSGEISPIGHSRKSPDILFDQQNNINLIEVAKMNSDEIVKLLHQLNLGPYTEIFQKEKINGDFFLLLEESDLIDLNISKRLDRKKILRVIELLAAGESISNYLTN